MIYFCFVSPARSSCSDDVLLCTYPEWCRVQKCKSAKEQKSKSAKVQKSKSAKVQISVKKTVFGDQLNGLGTTWGGSSQKQNSKIKGLSFFEFI